jgi:hypothetical protein
LKLSRGSSSVQLRFTKGSGIMSEMILCMQIADSRAGTPDQGFCVVLLLFRMRF